jgi:hypothetical protein
MLTHLIRGGVFALCLAAVAGARAQEATEIFVPIGQSPGVSGKLSLIGPIAAVDRANGTVTVAAAAGTKVVQITDRTRIWLDRSRLKLPNRTGTLADLQRGRTVEVKPQQDALGTAAEWIKVEVADASADPGVSR